MFTVLISAQLGGFVSPLQANSSDSSVSEFDGVSWGWDAYIRIVRNLDPSPCGAGNPGLQICAGKANPDQESGWFGRDSDSCLHKIAGE
jgi:hypothetical protein